MGETAPGQGLEDGKKAPRSLVHLANSELPFYFIVLVVATNDEARAYWERRPPDSSSVPTSDADHVTALLSVASN